MPRKNRDIRTKARDLIGSTKERFSDAKESTEDFISENPIKSVMIAAAIGAAIGAALTIGINAIVSPRRRTFAERVRDYF